MTDDQITWSLMSVFLAFTAIQHFAEAVVAFSRSDIIGGIILLVAVFAGICFSCKAWGQR